MMFNKSYNPDVLSCLANLSSDEVFTPPHIVNQMLDLLPEELFRDKNTTFLDPVCKSGVFLREIAKRLMEGLSDEIPDDDERRNHIFKNQLYGIGITELTSLLSRRSIYCSKTANGKYSVVDFDDEQGNIIYERIEHSWERGKCFYCGANKDEYERGLELETHAYQFIHTNNPETILNMRFDVIIGNPPYQMNDGGAGASAIPIYQKFVEQSKRLNPNYLVMIIPSRWFAGGKGLDGFRAEMIGDRRIKILNDFINAKECFPGISLGGGVCYFLWDKNYNGKCEVVNTKDGKSNTSFRYLDKYEIFIRNNNSISIIESVLNRDEFTSVKGLVGSRNPFGFPSSYRGSNTITTERILKLHSSDGESYVSINEVTQGDELIDVFKIMISKVTSEHAGEPDKSGMFRVLSTIKLLPPREVCTDSYLIIGGFRDEIEATNFMKYMKTKFFRFLLLQSVTSINLSKSKFQFIPLLKDYKLKDKELYKHYNLSQREIQEIENNIKDYK